MVGKKVLYEFVREKVDVEYKVQQPFPYAWWRDLTK